MGIVGAARYTTASVRQSNETMLVRQALAARTACRQGLRKRLERGGVVRRTRYELGF